MSMVRNRRRKGSHHATTGLLALLFPNRCSKWLASLPCHLLVVGSNRANRKSTAVIRPLHSNVWSAAELQEELVGTRSSLRTCPHATCPQIAGH